jgi:hypothetical protein
MDVVCPAVDGKFRPHNVWDYASVVLRRTAWNRDPYRSGNPSPPVVPERELAHKNHATFSAMGLSQAGVNFYISVIYKGPLFRYRMAFLWHH